MPGLDIAGAGELLKEFYLPPIRETLNRKTVLLQRIERNTEDFQGKRGWMPLHVGRNEGVGARAEKQALPAAGAQQYDTAYFNVCSNYGRIQVTGQTIAAMKSDEGSFTRAIDSETREVTKDMLQDLNRQLFGDGSSELGIANGGATSSTFTFSSTHLWRRCQHVRANMYVDVVDRATGTYVVQNAKVISVNASAGTCVLDQSITVTATSVMVRHGTYGTQPSITPTTPKEMWGLAAAISASNPQSIGGTSVYFGDIDRSGSNVDFWKAEEIDAASTSLDLDYFQQAMDAVDVKTGGNTTLMLSDYIQYRKHAKLLLPDRRFPTADGKPIQLDGGYKALYYDEVPHVRDKDCPPKLIFGLDEATFNLFELHDIDWMDKDGSILNRVPNEDGYEATLFCYKNLGCANPGANWRIKSLTE